MSPGGESDPGGAYMLPDIQRIEIGATMLHRLDADVIAFRDTASGPLTPVSDAMKALRALVSAASDI